MDIGLIIAIVVVAIVAVAVLAIAYLLLSRHRTSELHDRYGKEYERAVKKQGRRKGEQELKEREKRVDALTIRDLSAGERADFATQWTAIQGRFVEAPRSALQHADILVQQVMNTRGYPMSDFEQRAADISVDHAEVVTNYRSAHAISQRADSATTEEMRQAMLNYRELFDLQLGTTTSAAALST